MSNASETDWTRLAAMTDEDIDTSDIAELGDDFFARAELRTLLHQCAFFLTVVPSVFSPKKKDET